MIPPIDSNFQASFDFQNTFATIQTHLLPIVEKIVSLYTTAINNFYKFQESFHHASDTETKKRSLEHDKVRYKPWSKFLDLAWFGNNVDLKESLKTANINFQDLDGATVLHAAVLAGDFDGAQACLEARANVHAKEMRGQTALHWAARKGFVKLISLLVAFGADVNSADNRGKTPLRIAAKYGHSSTIALLVSVGAHIDAVDAKGETPFFAACKHGQMEVAHFLRNMGANRDIVNVDGRRLPEVTGKANVWAYLRCLFYDPFAESLAWPLNTVPQRIQATRTVTQLQY